MDSHPIGADTSTEAAGPSGHRLARTALESWLRLRAIDGMGDLTALQLVRHWHSPDAVLRASRDDLIQNGCSSQLADAIRRGPDGPACRSIERELKAIEREHIDVLSLFDPAYPARLKMIADPPPLLYITGTLMEQDELAVAIVGARRATAAGRVLTEELSHDLAAAGMTVVSGLARGVDAAAHRGALAAQGRTIAVLGCGSTGPIRRNMTDYAGKSRSGGRSSPRCRWARRPTAITFPGGIASSAACPWAWLSQRRPSTAAR